MYSVAELVTHLDKIGVRPGETLLVQASLRAIGPVAEGASGVVRALREALGADGTLVVYTATPENSRTSSYYRAAIAGLTPAELRKYHAAMPAWDAAATPASPTMGRLAEEVRLLPGALRSRHPQTSFTAIGPQARQVTERHLLRSHLGEESPAGRLYRSGARCLMIGVPVWCCTPLHLLEYWQPDRQAQQYRCVVRTPGGARRWRSFTGVRLQDEHFPAMGEVLAGGLGDALESGPLGDAHCYLMQIREAVDLADKWFRSGQS
ncbi:aminoglycoside N(3)-acetyltransferase [Kitasatospora griseola]|uniref:aminoglycoside N(3)-acetyltransferase n=1 Tax=Kitasatospora griseola TaxID=2064 RepID=UPI00167118FE|nr:AAC(3) family N-acetyltransferase [Kitasatospora griseola]GGQ75770.1 AAC(3) family N-acetyltransferase [Kitasatospora griseola]